MKDTFTTKFYLIDMLVDAYYKAREKSIHIMGYRFLVNPEMWQGIVTEVRERGAMWSLPGNKTQYRYLVTRATVWITPMATCNAATDLRILGHLVISDTDVGLYEFFFEPPPSKEREVTARIEGVNIEVTADGQLDITPVDPNEKVLLVPPVHIMNNVPTELKRPPNPPGVEVVTAVHVGPNQSFGKDVPKPIRESEK